MTVAQPTAVITARDVSRLYGERRALDHFSLDVPQGVVYGLLGPNGSGKSTFLSLVASMERPAEGEIQVFGAAPSSGAKANIGMVFQENAQDPGMTAMELLTLAGRMQGLGGGALTARATGLLATFGLSERTTDPIAKLSGGMRRRLEVARALVHDPALLLLDEPTTGIDPVERRNLWNALLGVARGARSILLATNDLAEADAVCEQVAFLRDGRLVATGSPEDLKSGLRRESVVVETADGVALNPGDIGALPGAGEVTVTENGLRITCDDSSALIPRLFELAPGAIRSVVVRSSTLEDAYFQHVGRRAEVPNGAAR